MFPPPPFTATGMQNTPPPPPNASPQQVVPPAMAAMKTPDPNLWAALTGVFMAQQAPPLISQHHPAVQSHSSTAQVGKPESEWKEYKTSEGRVFWHNAKNNRSTWEKPDELKSDIEKITATSSLWKEYPQGDGKSYWHNTQTKESEWDVPAEIARIRQSNEELDADDWSGKRIEGKSDARALFREFLERRCVGHLASWDAIGKILMRDPKWVLFNNVLTVGERKHIFNEHVNNLVKKNKDEQRIKKAQTRDNLADYLAKWKNGELPNKSKMTADAVFDDLEDKPEWRLLDLRERFETFEETAAYVAANAIQKCSSQKAEELTNWFRIVRGEFLSDDTSLNEVIAFTRKYFDGDLEEVNDLSIVQQWKSLVQSCITQSAGTSKVSQAFLYEREVRQCFKRLLEDCEREGILNAKTDWVEFLCQFVPLPSMDDRVCATTGNETVDTKREQVLTKSKLNVQQWIDDHHKLDNHDSHPMCVDNRYLLLHLQGGSSPKELFNDFVYQLWDLYEVVRDEAKGRLANGEMTCEADCDQWITNLAQQYQRPGVLTPLRQYCRKRVTPRPENE